MAGKVGKRAKHDISPGIRGAFVDALKKYQEKTGKGFSDIMLEMLEENPLELLKVMSKFTVREANVSVRGKVEHEHAHKMVSETQQWIDTWIEQDEKPAIEHQPETKQ